MVFQLIQGPCEGAATQLLRAGDVVQDADQWARQDTEVFPNLSTTDWTKWQILFIIPFIPIFLINFHYGIFAPMAEEVSLRTARDGQLDGDLMTDGALKLQLYPLNGWKGRNIFIWSFFFMVILVSLALCVTDSLCVNIWFKDINIYNSRGFLFPENWLDYSYVLQTPLKDLQKNLICCQAQLKLS